VEYIRTFLALDWEVVVQHSFCESNERTYALANYGYSMFQGSSFFYSCPTVCNSLYLANMLRITTPRPVSL
jgi:hypothetical protein